MSDFRIGKEMGALEARVARLEDLARRTTDNKACELEEPSTSNYSMLMIGPDGNEAGTDKIRVLDHPPIESLDLRIEGGCGRYNDGFPTYANYSYFRGRLWLQRKDNGDRIVFHYIETGYNTRCNVPLGRGVRSESRNSPFCDYGWPRDLSGRLTFGLWAKFRFEDGYGYDVSGITCFC